MAPKCADPFELPQDSTSSNEEEEEEHVSSTEKEEEEQEPKDDPKTQSIPSESQSEASVKPTATTKPIVVKALSSKRPRESEQEAKKKAKAGDEGSEEAAEGGGENTKKQLFQRIFSEDDEIALLKGMLDYFAKKGSDPCADTNAFYNFVKKSIHTDVTKAQVIDKIRRLKKKFENNAKGKMGEDKTFFKSHEHNLFELSKKIWGKQGFTAKVESLAAMSNGKAKGNNKVDGGVQLQPMEVDNNKASPKSLGSLFDKSFGVASMEEQVLKRGLNMVDGEKKIAFEAKWRNFQIRELALVLERCELIKDLAMSMLESYNSKDN